MNTLLALISGAVSAYVISAFLNHDRFLIFDIARSTIAGGVAISSIANMLVSPSVAMIIGVVRSDPSFTLLCLTSLFAVGSRGRGRRQSLRAKKGALVPRCTAFFCNFMAV